MFCSDNQHDLISFETSHKPVHVLLASNVWTFFNIAMKKSRESASWWYNYEKNIEGSFCPRTQGRGYKRGQVYI